MGKSCSQFDLLAGLVDLSSQLEADRTSNYGELQRRDRRIGLVLGKYRTKPVSQIVYWLNELRDTGETGLNMKYGGRASLACRLIGLFMLVGGLLLGWSTARLVFYYDGSQPVNIVHVLAIFVFLQLFLLGLLLLSIILQTCRRWLPPAERLSELVRLVSPGKLQVLLAHLLPQRYRRGLEKITGQIESHHRLYHGVQQWLIITWSQVFALAFNVGGIFCAVYLITFTDLAFAWSTTLEVEADLLHSITSVLSRPWSPWLMQATPSIELIESTRYFRFKDGALPGQSDGMVNLSGLGKWWPFLLSCMAFYGLLPRLVLLVTAKWRLRRRIIAAMMHLPDVHELLDRLNSELIVSQSAEPETSNLARPMTGELHSGTLSLDQRVCQVINWSSVPIDDNEVSSILQHHFGCTVSSVVHAGGSYSTDEDENTIVRLSQAGLKEQVIALLTRSWEPPMMELIDFIKALRKAIGVVIPIVVILFPAGDVSERPGVSPVMLRQWQDKLRSEGDPWLVVMSVDESQP